MFFRLKTLCERNGHKMSTRHETTFKWQSHYFGFYFEAVTTGPCNQCDVIFQKKQILPSIFEGQTKIPKPEPTPKDDE